jgi:hypothetical protein
LYLAVLFRRGVSLLDRQLGALFEVHHQRNGNPSTVGPNDVRAGAALPSQIALDHHEVLAVSALFDLSVQSAEPLGQDKTDKRGNDDQAGDGSHAHIQAAF